MLVDVASLELTEQVVTWVTKTQVVGAVIKGTERPILDKREGHGGENAVLQKPA